MVYAEVSHTKKHIISTIFTKTDLLFSTAISAFNANKCASHKLFTTCSYYIRRVVLCIIACTPSYPLEAILHMGLIKDVPDFGLAPGMAPGHFGSQSDCGKLCLYFEIW